MRGDDKKEPYARLYRIRDTAALVSSLSAIIMAFGVIGKFYVDSYRLAQLEKITEANRFAIADLQESHFKHVSISEGKLAEFNILAERVNQCCPLYRGR